MTLVERKTRFLATKLIPNKKSETVRKAILSAFEPFHQAVKSITLDNDIEFADPKIIASRLNTTVYFAHPHCLWGHGICFARRFHLLYKWPMAIDSPNAVPCSIFPKNKSHLLSDDLADCYQKLNFIF